MFDADHWETEDTDRSMVFRFVHQSCLLAVVNTGKYVYEYGLWNSGRSCDFSDRNPRIFANLGSGYMERRSSQKGKVMKGSLFDNSFKMYMVLRTAFRAWTRSHLGIVTYSGYVCSGRVEGASRGPPNRCKAVSSADLGPEHDLVRKRGAVA